MRKAVEEATKWGGRTMPRRISPMPNSFSSAKERHYWHMAQDIAYRAGVSLCLRDGSTWLVSDDGERRVCDPQELIWYRTWLVLHDEFGRLSRLWVGGRPATEPGE